MLTMQTTGVARIGISGWTYRPWRGAFYPAGLPVRDELPFAAERLDSIEINGTFYRLQRPGDFARWRTVTPPAFVFSVKGGRYITHLLKLRGVQAALANFFASGVLGLSEKLGPFLWQLPPTLPLELETVDAFLRLLPASVGDARRLATQATLDPDRVDVAVSLPDAPLRHALEVRHESFADPRLYALLRERNVALVAADTAGRWPHVREVTADHVYVRLHGDAELYTSGYTDRALDEWANLVRGWLSGRLCPDGIGRDVYVYFDNDAKVRAPFDAIGLKARLAL